MKHDFDKVLSMMDECHDSKSDDMVLKNSVGAFGGQRMIGLGGRDFYKRSDYWQDIETLEFAPENVQVKLNELHDEFKRLGWDRS